MDQVDVERIIRASVVAAGVVLIHSAEQGYKPLISISCRGGLGMHIVVLKNDDLGGHVWSVPKNDGSIVLTIGKKSLTVTDILVLQSEEWEERFKTVLKGFDWDGAW